MWLLGFNDMQPGEPRAICDMVTLTLTLTLTHQRTHQRIHSPCTGAVPMRRQQP